MRSSVFTDELPKLALEQLHEQGTVDLDEEHNAQMVSNLLVILCSESETTPVVNMR